MSEKQNETKICKKCRTEIDKKAKICPQCRAKQGIGVLGWIGIVFLVLIVIGAIGGGGDKGKPATTAAPTAPEQTAPAAAVTPEAPPAPVVAVPDVVISSGALAKAYVDNEVKADQTYKGKLAEITGEISDIGVMLGQTYITLKSDDQMSFTDIQCFFDDKAEVAKIANLSKGQTVTVTGKIDGKSMNVGVNGCVLKE